MYQTESKYLYKKLGRKYGLPEDEVRIIIRSAFEYVSHCIRTSDPYNGKFSAIEVIGFGKFGIKKGLIEKKLLTKAFRDPEYVKKLQFGGNNFCAELVATLHRLEKEYNGQGTNQNMLKLQVLKALRSREKG